MKQRQTYATKLTKEELINAGITLITKDGLVFKGDKQVNLYSDSQGYLNFCIYRLDEDGNKIKRPIKRQYKGCSKVTDTYTFEQRTIGLHRAM